MTHITSIAQVIAAEHAAADEAHVTGLDIAHCQQYIKRNAALVEKLTASHFPGDMLAYVPTAADRENDRKIDEWKARQREADARVILASVESERRRRVAACIDAYAERMGSAA